MPLAGKQARLAARLGIIEDPQERLAALMSRAKKWPAPAELRDAERVRGCQSGVWIEPRIEDGLIRLRMECDSPMVKGLVALLCELYDSEPPAAVAAFEPGIIEALGFDKMITPTRLAGLGAVRERLREFAKAAGA